MKSTKARKRLLVALVFSLVFVSDWVSKYWARQVGLAVLNQGGVWGLMPGLGWVFVSTVVMLAVSAYLWWNRYKLSIGEVVGIVVILAAGLGNLLDRILFGGVWDFIYYPILKVVGNVADIWLVVGVLILLRVKYLHGNTYSNI